MRGLHPRAISYRYRCGLRPHAISYPLSAISNKEARPALTRAGRAFYCIWSEAPPELATPNHQMSGAPAPPSKLRIADS